MENENIIKRLKLFFTVSCTAFDLVANISIINKGYTNPSYMHSLHKLALQEINQDKPDLKIIDWLLSRMELATKINNYGRT